MSREIKFRAWDKEGERMFHYGSPYVNSIGLLEFGILEPFPDMQRLEVELMRYTGLKDKNGVEIYEGDIVWAYYDPVEDGKWYKYPMVIEWDEDHAGFESVGKRSPVSGGMRASIFEVIGNVFENPELVGRTDG